MEAAELDDRMKELVDASCQFYIDLAEAAFYIGNLEHAAWAMHKALEEAESLGPESPRLPAALNRLGVLYYYLGKYLGAEPLLQRAISLTDEAGAGESAELGTLHYNLGGLYKAQGRFPEAESAFNEALGIWERTLGPEHPDLALAFENLGDVCAHQGRSAEALLALRRALEILESCKQQDWVMLVVLTKLATFYTDQERYAEAEPHLWRALELRKRLQGDRHPKVAQNLKKLARIFRKQQKFARAEPLYRLSLSIQEKALGRGHADFIGTLADLAELYYSEGRVTEAEPLYKMSLAAFEQALGEEHPHVADRLEDYAAVLRGLYRSDDAAILEARARAIRAKHSTAL
jgi:tetratricopeptide (TPR) repeat protein